jgi:hypothetical protein
MRLPISQTLFCAMTKARRDGPHNLFLSAAPR